MIAVSLYQRAGDSGIQQLTMPFAAFNTRHLPLTLPKILSNSTSLLFKASRAISNVARHFHNRCCYAHREVYRTLGFTSHPCQTTFTALFGDKRGIQWEQGVAVC